MGQHLAFVGNCCWKDHIESRYAVRCYYKESASTGDLKLFRSYLVDVPHLASIHQSSQAFASHTLTELKEFTYWLFKRRIKIWDPARVASDTRKGLEKLQSLRGADTTFGL